MTEGTTEAVETIITVMGDKETAPAIRLQAAGRMLELYTKYRDMEAGINVVTFRELDAGKINLEFIPQDYPSGL